MPSDQHTSGRTASKICCFIMEKDIVRAALRVAKEVDATDEEWQTFMKMLKERKR